MSKRLVRCPTCKKTTEYSATNGYRPFCSERCQLLDLGDWAAGKFAIPTEDGAPGALGEPGATEESGAHERRQQLAETEDDDGTL
jgi:uncharacterized protein